MALQTLSTAPTNTSATTFRAWGSAVSAAIAANGQVQTADTGQINWTTVAAPSTISTAMGYEIWRFNDTLQASAPIYFKLEYGSGSSTINPAMWITVGTGSDGAGTITGTFFAGLLPANVLAPRVVVGSSVTGLFGGSSATANNSYCNGDSSALALWLWPTYTSSASTGALLLLERSRNWDGTANGDGYILWNATATGTGNVFVPVSYLGNGYTLPSINPAGNYQPGSVSNIHGVTTNLSGTVYAQPFFTGFNLRLGAPSQYVLGCHIGDLLGGTPYTLTHYGTARTWWSSGLGASAGGVGAVCGGMKAFLYRMS